jgi:beta-alanine degradation protein BauB
MEQDPVATNPELYSVVFENARVRVLEYRDVPGTESQPHSHPDSVMVTLSTFDRRLSANGRQADLSLDAGEARWLPAQSHSGTNIGSTETHAIFIELKEPRVPKDRDGGRTEPLGEGEPLGEADPLGPS